MAAVLWVFIAVSLTDSLIATVIYIFIPELSQSKLWWKEYADFLINAVSLVIGVMLWLIRAVIRRIKDNASLIAGARSNKHIWLILLLYTSSAVSVQMALISQPSTIAIVAATGLFVCSTVFLVTVYKSFHAFREYTYVVLQKEMQSKILSEQKVYLGTVLEKEDELRSFQHDMSAHLSYLTKLLEQGDIYKANAHIHKVAGIVNYKDDMVWSGHRTLDILLCSIQQRYRELPIQWKGHLSEEIGVCEIDLCLLFANILNNAFNAAIKCDTQNQFVQVDVKTHSNAIYIFVCNSISEPVTMLDGRPVRRENEGGYGIRNIEDVVESYKGNVQYIVSDSTFALELILYCDNG